MSTIADSLMETSAIKQALAEPMLAAWDKERPFMIALQAQGIGKVLVQQVHKHLTNAKIGYLFREKITDRWAHASRVGAKLAFYSKLDFLIEINWTAWDTLEARQRVALVDHELCHFGVESTETGDRYVIIEHDIEEFGSVIQRWGLWRPDVTRFHRVMVQQLDAFEQSTT